MNASHFTAALNEGHGGSTSPGVNHTTAQLEALAATTIVTFCDQSCATLPVFVISDVLSVLSLLANAMIIGVIALTPAMRRSGDGMLMADLCVSNMVTAIVVGSLSTCSVQTRLLFSLPACILTGVAFNTTTTAAFVAIAAMAFDRYLAVAYHLRYASLAGPAKYAAFLVVQWTLCTVVNLLPLFHKGTTWCARRFGGCSYETGGPAIYVTVAILYLPCAVAIVFSYARIWAVIHKMPATAGAEAEERKQRIRGVRTTVIILTAYVVTTLPRAVTALVYAAQSATQKTNSAELIENLSALFLNSNSLLSPIIYGLTNRAIKEKLASLIRRMQSNTAKIEPAARPGNSMASHR